MFTNKNVLLLLLTIFVLVLVNTLPTIQSAAPEPVGAEPPCKAFALLQPSFFPLSGYDVRALRSADVNNDGIPDMVTVLPNDHKLSVQLGDGKGEFSTSEFPAGLNPTDLEFGDFNRDGEKDIAVTNKSANLISILIGDGAGNFAFQTSFESTTAPQLLEVGYFDNDNYLDIAVANSFSLKIFRGRRDLTFELASTAAVQYSGPQVLTSADFNNDGKLDLAASYIEGNGRGLTVFLGQGNNSFVPSTAYPEIYAYALDTADVDRNGTMDLLANDYSTGRTLFYKGNNNGTFQVPVVSNSGGHFGIETLDYNSDGILDFATTSAIHLGDGAGNFSFFTGLGIPVGVTSVAVADFNSDNLPDVATVSGNGGGYNSTAVTFNNSGQRISVGTSAFTRGRAYDLNSADFNLDGRNDLISVDAYNNTAWVFLQDANGQMISTEPRGLPVGGGFNVSGFTFSVADFNGDGKPDFAAPDSFARKVVTFTGNGDGTFVRRVIDILSNTSSPTLVRTGDFNRDGRTDMVALSNASRNFIVMLNDGNNGFTPLPPQAVGSSEGPNKVAVGDFTGDGIVDLIVARYFDFNLLLLRGNGDGSFVAISQISAAVNVTEIQAGDYDNDGFLDYALTAGETNGLLKIGFGAGKGTFSETVNFTIEGSAHDFDIKDFDADGLLDIAVASGTSNTIVFFKGNGNRLFNPGIKHYSGPNPFVMTTSDFNGDGKPDFAFAPRFNATINIKYNATNLLPCLSVNNAQIREGHSGTANVTFEIRLTEPSADVVTVNYNTYKRTGSSGDFENAAGSIEFQPGVIAQSVNVRVNGDLLDEEDETFTLTLSNAERAVIRAGVGVATILDDDAPPSLSIGNVTYPEGNISPGTIQMPAVLSGVSGRKVKFRIATDNVTASANEDYYAVFEPFFIEPGESAKDIIIDAIPDYRVEPDETFAVRSSNFVNVTPPAGTSLATIVNDDIGGVVQFAVSNISVSENGGTLAASVSRVNGNASHIVVGFQTADVTAVQNQDYMPVQGTITFGANESSKTILIPLVNNSLNEDTENFKLILSSISGGATLGSETNLTINIDDDDPLPGLFITDRQITEGSAGHTTVSYVINLPAASGRNVSVNYALENGTATSPSDYFASAGSLTFAPGETTKNFQLTVVGDTVRELDETLSVTLSNTVNAVISSPAATVTIVNDDESAPRADFDGDGKSDLSVYRPFEGNWYVLRSTAGYNVTGWGLANDIVAPGDFDGDGKADFAMFRPSEGNWYIANSGGTFTTGQFGLPGDIPVPADYDGDGKDDRAVFRPSNSTWYILNSNGLNVREQAFGLSGDRPVPGDYDGDLKADLSVFRPSNGTWYRANSGNGNFVEQQWGLSGDIPVNADYDGDNKQDFAVFRPSAASWYILNSSNGSYNFRSFGLTGDVPVPGDYDGNGSDDIAVFRNGFWYIIRSAQVYSEMQFGLAGDTAIPGKLTQ